MIYLEGIPAQVQMRWPPLLPRPARSTASHPQGRCASSSVWRQGAGGRTESHPGSILSRRRDFSPCFPQLWIQYRRTAPLPALLDTSGKTGNRYSWRAALGPRNILHVTTRWIACEREDKDENRKAILWRMDNQWRESWVESWVLSSSINIIHELMNAPAPVAQPSLAKLLGMSHMPHPSCSASRADVVCHESWHHDIKTDVQNAIMH